MSNSVKINHVDYNLHADLFQPLRHKQIQILSGKMRFIQ